MSNFKIQGGHAPLPLTFRRPWVWTEDHSVLCSCDILAEEWYDSSWLYAEHDNNNSVVQLQARGPNVALG